MAHRCGLRVGVACTGGSLLVTTGARIGLLLIGDELLSGKRADKHMPRVIDMLAERGMSLDWARLVGDDAGLLETTLRQTMAGPDIVFSFGGIGATPDDRTRQCAAAAAGRSLEFNAEGRAILEHKYGARAYPKRIHMVEWPTGALVIPNPINQVPGFSLGHHHFVPGFPNMAWPMVAWVLDTYYSDLQQADHDIELMVEALETPESALIDLMQEVMDRHRDVRISCLPSSDGRQMIEFGVRGKPSKAQAAYDDLERALVKAGVPLGRQM